MSVNSQPPRTAAEKRALLARMLEQRTGRPRQAPTSFAQQRLWFIDQLAPGNPAYHIVLSLRVPMALSPAVLAAALRELIRRHEILRTSFAAVDGRPVQVIAAPATPRLPVIDLRALPDARRQREAKRIVGHLAVNVFDLARGPLLRCELIQMGEATSVVVLVLHHIVADGWSMDVLSGELLTLCRAFAAGGPSPLPDLPVQYADFARWQRDWLRDDVLAAQLVYWQPQLQGAAVLELPTDRPRPALQSFRGGGVQIVLPAALCRAARSLAQAEGSTLFMVLLAAFKVLLHRYTGQEDVNVGSQIAGRNRRELEGLIGLFVNTLVLRTDLAGEPSFREVLGRVRETALGAFSHQEMPFEAAALPGLVRAAEHADGGGDRCRGGGTAADPGDRL